MHCHSPIVKNNYLIIRIIILSVPFFFSSCGTSRKTAVELPAAVGTNILLQKMSDSGLAFETFSARFSATYSEGETEASFSGTLRIRRDSIIWMSFSPAMGIEVMRAVITRDSVKILDRIHRTSVVTDFGYIRRWVKVPVDLDMIEALITGNCWVCSGADGFRSSVDRRLYRLDFSGTFTGVDAPGDQGRDGIPLPFQIWLDPENFKVVRTLVKETQGKDRDMEAIYTDFKMAGEQTVPSGLTFRLRDAGRRLELSLHYIRMKLDEPLAFPFSIPEDFTRVTE